MRPELLLLLLQLLLLMLLMVELILGAHVLVLSDALHPGLVRGGDTGGWSPGGSQGHQLPVVFGVLADNPLKSVAW